jgi:hypothetical protein
LAVNQLGRWEQVVHGEPGFLYDLVAWRGCFKKLVESEALREHMSAEAARNFWKRAIHAEMRHIHRSPLENLVNARRRRKGS